MKMSPSWSCANAYVVAILEEKEIRKMVVFAPLLFALIVAYEFALQVPCCCLYQKGHYIMNMLVLAFRLVNPALDTIVCLIK